MDISIALFEECNNNCLFCYNRNSNNKTDYMKFDEDKYIEAINKLILSTKCEDSLSLEIIGGELFTNDYPLFKLKFHNFLLELYSKFSIKNITLTSNLMYSNKNITKHIEHTLLFIKKFIPSVRLCTSYDICWRFNKIDTLQNFKNNVKSIRKVLKNNNLPDLAISMILANRPMRLACYEYVCNPTLLETKCVSYFHKLLNMGLKFYVEFMEPITPAWNREIITTETMKIFYEYIIDHGYKKQFEILDSIKDKKSIFNLFKKEDNTARIVPHCGGPQCILVNAEIANSCWKWHDKKTDDPKNIRLKQLFLRKYNCIKCPFYNRCRFSCYRYALLYEDRNCVYKYLFEKYGVN